MTVTVHDFHDPVEPLQPQPDWRAELRRIEIDYGNFQGVRLEEWHRRRPFVFFR